MKDAASISDLNISNHQHDFTHSTTLVFLLLPLQFLLPQLKTQVSCSVANPTFSSFSSLATHKSGAASSCTSGGWLASGHRVFQSLLSSIQHQVPSPSIRHLSCIVSFPQLEALAEDSGIESGGEEGGGQFSLCSQCTASIPKVVQYLSSTFVFSRMCKVW